MLAPWLSHLPVFCYLLSLNPESFVVKNVRATATKLLFVICHSNSRQKQFCKLICELSAGTLHIVLIKSPDKNLMNNHSAKRPRSDYWIDLAKRTVFDSLRNVTPQQHSDFVHCGLEENL